MKNILTGQYEVYYSGQNKGGLDYLLTESVKSFHHFRIYYRKRKTDCFTFLGVSTQSSIIRERKAKIKEDSEITDRLQIRLVLQAKDVINQEIEAVGVGSGKYKRGVLAHSGVVDFSKYNLSIGFYLIKTWFEILIEILNIRASLDKARCVIGTHEGAFVSITFLYKDQETLDSNKELVDKLFEKYSEYIISTHMVDPSIEIVPY